MIYAQRLLDRLGASGHETHVVLSAYAQTVIREELSDGLRPVSYTHLTLPTICSV